MFEILLFVYAKTHRLKKLIGFKIKIVSPDITFLIELFDLLSVKDDR